MNPTLIERLREVLPAESLITHRDALLPFEPDGLTAVRQVPAAVALPETKAQLEAVVRTCRELGVPIVPRGAGTGLSGGARPLADGLLVVLSKLNRIIAID